MSQSFIELSPAESNTEIANDSNINFAALRSCFSGETAPDAPVTGQLWFKPSTGELFQFDGADWQPVGLPQEDGNIANLRIRHFLEIRNNFEEAAPYLSVHNTTTGVAVQILSTDNDGALIDCSNDILTVGPYVIFWSNVEFQGAIQRYKTHQVVVGSSGITLTAEHSGQTVVFNDEGGTATLPAPAAGLTFRFINQGSGFNFVARSGSAVIWIDDLDFTSVYTVGHGGLVLESDGVDYFAMGKSGYWGAEP